MNTRGALCLFVSLVLLISIVPDQLGRGDFVEYWSSTRLFLNGLNPYDYQLLLKEQQSVLHTVQEPTRMWNPPIIFALTFPLGLLSFPVSVKIWLLLSIGLYSWAVLYCMGQMQERQTRIWFVIYCSTSFPLALSLGYGQFSPVLLAALVAAHRSISPLDNTNQDNSIRSAWWTRIIGGAYLAITLIKPHLLAIYYLGLFIFWPRRGMLILLSATGILIGVALIIWLVHPTIWSDYLSSWQQPPLYWQTPTLGSLLQRLTGKANLLVRSLPLIISLSLLILYWLARGRRFALDPISLIPISLAVSPYGWVYDQMLLVPFVSWLLIRNESSLSEFSDSAPGSRNVSQLNWLQLTGPAVLLIQVPYFVFPSSWGQQLYWFVPCLMALLPVIFRVRPL